MSDDKIKGKVINLLEKAKEKGREIKQPTVNINSTGNNNTLIAGDNNKIINTQKHVEKTEFTPGAEHITSAQAKAVQDAVKNLVSKEEAGGMTRSSAFAKWYGALKGRYNIPTYLAIPSHLGDEAIAWLKQQSAIKRTKIRRPNNQQWRNELYSAIWARARNLKLSKGDVYHIVNERLDKQVTSLKQLGEQNLKKLHRIIMAM